MNEAATTPKPKKSVALSGVVAGNTALCSVGRSGNDLHYRGYDILEIANTCEFEEIAYLLVHEKLPNAAELAAYRRKLAGLRGLPGRSEDHPRAAARIEPSPWTCCARAFRRWAASHPSAPGTRPPARATSPTGCWRASARCSATGITTAANGAASRSKPTMPRSAGTSCTCCTDPPSAEWVRAMHTSLILYAEHEFNASTFTARVIAGTGSDLYSAITGAIGALRGPKHGGANEVAFEIQNRYQSPDEAEADIRRRVADKEIIIGFGHPVYTISDPRNVVISEVARSLAERLPRTNLFAIAARLETVMKDDEEHVPEPRLVQRVSPIS